MNLAERLASRRRAAAAALLCLERACLDPAARRHPLTLRACARLVGSLHFLLRAKPVEPAALIGLEQARYHRRGGGRWQSGAGSKRGKEADFKSDRLSA